MSTHIISIKDWLDNASVKELDEAKDEWAEDTIPDARIPGEAVPEHIEDGYYHFVSAAVRPTVNLRKPLF